MKICDIVQFYSPLGGGVKRYLEDKMRYVSHKAGIEHFAIVPTDCNAISTKYHSRIYEIRSLPLLGSLSYRMLLNRKRIFKVIEQEHPDLIEVGDPYRSAWIALQVAGRYKIPVVAFYHSDFPRALGRTISRFCGPWVERFLSRPVDRYVRDLYNRMSATVVASRRMECLLKECGIQRVVRIPLGTDVWLFRPNLRGAQIVREELGLRENDYLLLFVGRLAREKNIRSLMGMMNHLNGSTGSEGRYHLLLVGDGELRYSVERLLKSKTNITWYQYCNSVEQLTAYYTAADLFVHAGRSETFGITSLEAQACGTRVLAVRYGGLDDSVLGEDPHIMTVSPDPADLAEGVRCVRDLLYSQLPETRRQRMIDHFSIHLTYERLFSLYDHILSGKPVEQFSFSQQVENNELAHPTVFTD